jgi:hypothetical protein
MRAANEDLCERGNDAFPLSELQAAVLIPQLASSRPRTNSGASVKRSSRLRPARGSAA